MDIITFILDNQGVYLTTLLDDYLCQFDNKKHFCSFLSRQHSNLPPSFIKAIEKHCDWAHVSFNAAKVNRKDLLIKLAEAKTIRWNAALNGACKGKHLELIKYTMSHGAKIVVDTFALAAEHDDTAIFEYLLSHLNDEQLTPFLARDSFIRVFARICNVKLVNWLIERLNGNLLFFLFRCACEKNGLVCAEAIMKKGQSKSVVSQIDIQIGFESACHNGHIDMIPFLVHHGANNFQAGLCCAVVNYHTDIVKLMKTYGAQDNGLLEEHQQRVDRVYNYLNSALCRDILTTLSTFIDIEYQSPTICKIICCLVGTNKNIYYRRNVLALLNTHFRRPRQF